MSYTATVVLGVATVSVTAMLWSESRSPRWEWLFKPLASLCFLALALEAGALDSAYGLTLLAGLTLCLAGDVLLIPTHDKTFVAGLAAFLLGHMLYGFAFLQLPTQLFPLLVGLLPAVILGVGSLRWLWPHVPDPMRVPVAAYIVVICTMLVLAAGTWGSAPAPWILLGAWGFALSDLSVARNQFISREMKNRLWGIPLYFASQLLLAWSVRFA